MTKKCYEETVRYARSKYKADKGIVSATSEWVLRASLGKIIVIESFVASFLSSN